MARRLILLLTIGMIAACGSAAGASSTGSTSASSIARCGPTAATTLGASPQARVYALGKSVYACAPGHGAPYRIGGSGPCNGSTHIGPVAVAGTIAAYGATQCGVDTGSATIVVRDVASRHQLAVLASYSGPAHVESYQWIGSVVANRSGAAAWIVRESSIVAHSATIEVVRRAGSSTQVVASGSKISPSSLQLHGSTISWTNAGVRHTAPLA